MILTKVPMEAVAQTHDTPPLNLPKNPVISLNLKNADVTDVFRLLAEQNDLNIVVSPTVGGIISIRLSDVTLEEALKVILEASNSHLERTENIIYISARADAEKRAMIKDEMITEIFSINYVDSEQLLSVINEFLSPNGKARTFYRSKNLASVAGKPPMLIIIDYPQNVDTIRRLIDNLDKETPQILIQAKIIETSLDNSDILGTDWTTKINFKGSPMRFDTKYAAAGMIDYGILSLDAFSAVWQRVLDNKNNNVLSDAKLTTLDNEKASIHVGETIPVGVTSMAAGGTNGISFGTTNIQEWDVGITLDVTPHVLDGGVIMMKIEPEVSNVKSFASLGGTGASNAPITSKRTVETNIMLSSGETIVIAGLVQNSETTRDASVPFLGKLPVVGSLFRKKETVNTKSNLLIFITAKIMELRGKTVADDKTGASSSAAPSMPGNDKKLDEFLEYK